MSANRSSAGERSHRALIPHANFRKRAPLVPSPFPGAPLLPPTLVPRAHPRLLRRLVLLHNGDNPLYCFSNKSLSACHGKRTDRSVCRKKNFEIPSECIARLDIALLRRNIIYRAKRREYFKRNYFARAPIPRNLSYSEQHIINSDNYNSYRFCQSL